MLKRVTRGLSEANQWAQKSDGAAIGQAFRDIVFNVTKLSFALTYFFIALADIPAGGVENVVNRRREARDRNRLGKLKKHLSWKRPDDSERPGVLRR